MKIGQWVFILIVAALISGGCKQSNPKNAIENAADFSQMKFADVKAIADSLHSGKNQCDTKLFGSFSMVQGCCRSKLPTITIPTWPLLSRWNRNDNKCV